MAHRDPGSMTVAELVEKLESYGFETDGGHLATCVHWGELKRQTCAAQLPDMAMLVERFNREVIGLPIPSMPLRIAGARRRHALEHMQEELNEFSTSTSIQDDADALIDLVYVALGRLIEMGLTPRPIFEEVHLANMRKVRGDKSTRPNAVGHDATKPKGWTPPDLTPYLQVNRTDLEWLQDQKQIADAYEPEDFEDQEQIAREEPGGPRGRYVGLDRPVGGAVQAIPKILVLGHGRHGKDTVSEIMRDLYGLSFTSSSIFCAERVIWPLVKNDRGKSRKFFLNNQPSENQRDAMWGELLEMAKQYSTVEDCFEGRGDHRTLWYEAIKAFNTPDASALGRAIFKEHDIYCGLRSKAELNALMNAGVPDVVVWVDALDRLPPEPTTSITVEPWMAHFVIDNNSGEEVLRRNVEVFMDHFLDMWGDA